MKELHRIFLREVDPSREQKQERLGVLGLYAGLVKEEVFQREREIVYQPYHMDAAGRLAALRQELKETKDAIVVLNRDQQTPFTVTTDRIEGGIQKFTDSLAHISMHTVNCLTDVYWGFCKLGQQAKSLW